MEVHDQPTGEKETDHAEDLRANTVGARSLHVAVFSLAGGGKLLSEGLGGEWGGIWAWCLLLGFLIRKRMGGGAECGL